MLPSASATEHFPLTLTLSLRERGQLPSDGCLANNCWANSGTVVIERRWTILPYRCSKVIHRRRGESCLLSPQPTVNNFGPVKIVACQQPRFRLSKGRHAGLGRRITVPLRINASGETFAPSPALWSKTNTQRSTACRLSIRLSPVQSLA